MNIIGIIIGLIVAVIVYVVLTAVIHFANSSLVFGLIALLIFLAIAFNPPAVGTWRRQP